jgi:hypothetical protein
MVLPPSCCGNNVAHVHTAGKEDTPPHYLHTKVGYPSKKNEHRMVLNPKILLLCSQHSVRCLFVKVSMVADVCVKALHGTILLVVEPDYLPDSEVLAFSYVYTP